MDRNIIVTGHVDHGKTTFIKALDRFINAEPKYTFGMDEVSYSVRYSIGGETYNVFDYAGHHQYLDDLGKNNEWAAIVICAATDGPMGETRKHIELCRERGIKRIAVLFNKCDLVMDDELVDLIEWDLDEILEENGFSTDCPKLRASAEKALEWASEEDKKAFFGFLANIHRME